MYYVPLSEPSFHPRVARAFAVIVASFAAELAWPSFNLDLLDERAVAMDLDSLPVIE